MREGGRESEREGCVEEGDERASRRKRGRVSKWVDGERRRGSEGVGEGGRESEREGRVDEGEGRVLLRKGGSWSRRVASKRAR